MKLSSFVLAATHGIVGSAIVFQLRGSNIHDSWKVAGAAQPTAVAKTLSKVESEWRSQALQFVECNAEPNHGNCETAAGTFQKSCGTVVNSVVAASNGDRETVREYMAAVCDELRAYAWKKGCCKNFAQTVLDTMSANNHENRLHLFVPGLCANFWKNMSSDIAAQEHQLQEKQTEAEKAKHAWEAAEKAEADAALKKSGAAHKAAEAQAAEAEAKLKEAEKEMLEIRQKMFEGQAGKAVIPVAQPANASSGTHTPTQAKHVSPVAKTTSNNSKMSDFAAV